MEGEATVRVETRPGSGGRARPLVHGSPSRGGSERLGRGAPHLDGFIDKGGSTRSFGDERSELANGRGGGGSRRAETLQGRRAAAPHQACSGDATNGSVDVNA